MSIVFDINLKIFKENGKELTSKDLTHVKDNYFIMNSIPDRDVVSMYNKIFYFLFFAIWLDEEIKYNNGYSDKYIYASIPNKTENKSYKIYNDINSKEEYKQRIISLEKYNKYCFDDNIYFNLYKNMISDILKKEYNLELKIEDDFINILYIYLNIVDDVSICSDLTSFLYIVYRDIREGIKDFITNKFIVFNPNYKPVSSPKNIENPEPYTEIISYYYTIKNTANGFSSYDFTPYSGQIHDPYGDFYLDREICKIVHDMIVTDSPKCAEVEEYVNIVIEEAKKYFSEIEIDAGLQESFPFFIWFIYYKIKQRG